MSLSRRKYFWKNIGTKLVYIKTAMVMQYGRILDYFELWKSIPG